MIEPLPGAVTPKRKTPDNSEQDRLLCPRRHCHLQVGARQWHATKGPVVETTFPLHNGDNSPEKWTVDDVAEFVSRIPGCEHIAEKFRHHKIDGVALFLFKEHHLVKMMNVKLGPALKLCATINSLH
ncbi:hypothetical protein MRX96_039257 [Rhipicephalus microplus]